MATGDVVVNVVDVGQGQCTFVEIYNTAGTLIHTLLFDCGTDKYSTETVNNLKYIADKVSSMKPPAFDSVFLSHSDKDHISLLKPLLGKFLPAKKPAIKEVWYGGNYTDYAKSSFNILDYLKIQCYCNNFYAPDDNLTDYDPNNGRYKYSLWISDDKEVSVSLLVGNVVSDKPGSPRPAKKQRTPEQKNRVSLICGLYYDKISYIICGDATMRTMGWVNYYFEGATVFNKNIMVTLPHHGSRTTGLDVSGAKDASSNAIKTVETFSGILKSKTITASATDTKNHHPSLELIEMFVPETIQQPVLEDSRLKQKGVHVHRARAYIDEQLKFFDGKIVQKTYKTFDTDKNLFTTNYSDTPAFVFTFPTGSNTVSAPKGTKSTNQPINEFASWVYTTAASMVTMLEGRANLSFAAFTKSLNSMAVLSMENGEFPPNDIQKKVPEARPKKELLARSSRPAFSPAQVRPPALPHRLFPGRLKAL